MMNLGVTAGLVWCGLQRRGPVHRRKSGEFGVFMDSARSQHGPATPTHSHAHLVHACRP